MHQSRSGHCSHVLVTGSILEGINGIWWLSGPIWPAPVANRSGNRVLPFGPERDRLQPAQRGGNLVTRPGAADSDPDRPKRGLEQI